MDGEECFHVLHEFVRNFTVHSPARSLFFLYLLRALMFDCVAVAVCVLSTCRHFSVCALFSLPILFCSSWRKMSETENIMCVITSEIVIRFAFINSSCVERHWFRRWFSSKFINWRMKLFPSVRATRWPMKELHCTLRKTPPCRRLVRA